MKSITFNIPDTLDINDKEIAMIVASKLYENGKLSLGEAADLVGYSKRTFAELLGKFGVSLFNHSSDDLTNDLKNA